MSTHQPQTEASPVVEYTFDRPRLFQWSSVAAYRLGCVNPMPRSRYAQTVAFLWASLLPDREGEFATPENFAQLVDPEKTEQFIDQIVKKLCPAYF